MLTFLGDFAPNLNFEPPLGRRFDRADCFAKSEFPPLSITAPTPALDYPL